MPFVYRIENAEGDGPYRKANNLSIPMYCSDDHPNPVLESELNWLFLDDREEWYFGFNSMEQLNRWFYDEEWLYEMHSAGFRITVWDVPFEGLYTSRSQAIFIREDADLVATRSLISQS